MPPQRRRQQAARQEGPPQGEEERLPRSGAHQEHVQQHDHLHHRPYRRRDLVGLLRPGRLQGLAQVDPLRRADGRRGRRSSRQGARHEARSTSSSRARAPAARPRSVRSGHRPRGRLDQDVTPQAHNGAARPSAAGSEREGNSRNGSIHRTHHQKVPSPQDRPGRRRQGLRAPSLPARPARPRADQGEGIPHPAAGEAEGPLHLRRHGEAVPSATTRKPRPVPARPATPCCRSSSPGSTTSSTARASPAPGGPPASPSRTATSRSTGARGRPVVPRRAVRHRDGPQAVGRDVPVRAGPPRSVTARSRRG